MKSIAEKYKNCRLCPRFCGADRGAGEKGFCGEGAAIRIACASIHTGEEPPITEKGGSGTIFFSGCTLRCAFCQNYQISQNGTGAETEAEEFIKIMLALQKAGAANINLVTGTQHIPIVINAVKKAKARGLVIPVVWNSSGYETLESIEMLNEIIDIYLPDLKTLDSGFADKFYGAPSYPQYASNAVKKMMDSAGKKVIVRHLVIPGYLAQTKEILRWFADNVREGVMFSLMTQYTPVQNNQRLPSDKYLSGEEYAALLKWFELFNIEEGYYQELEPDSGWLPDFNKINPFDSGRDALWHWKYGFTAQSGI